MRISDGRKHIKETAEVTVQRKGNCQRKVPENLDEDRDEGQR